jgi:hypothetical protein
MLPPVAREGVMCDALVGVPVAAFFGVKCPSLTLLIPTFFTRTAFHNSCCEYTRFCHFLFIFVFWQNW